MLQWFESDGVTPLGNIPLGSVGPGETYTGKHAGVALQVVLKNTGVTDIETVTVAITQVSNYPAAEYALIAQGATQPAAGPAWVDHEGSLAIGTLEPNDAVNIWIDADVPLIAPRGTGQMVTLRAAGAQT